MFAALDPEEMYESIIPDPAQVAEMLAQCGREEAAEAEAYAADDAREREYVREAVIRLTEEEAEYGNIPPAQVAVEVLEVLPERNRQGALIVRYRAVDGAGRKVAYCSYDYPDTQYEPGDAGEYLDWEVV